MDDAGARSIDDGRVKCVFDDFMGRRDGIIRSFTTDFEEFFKQCDPEKEEELCLFGFPDGQWKVCLPPEDVPPEIPDPTLGINFSRDGMEVGDWLYLVAIHSNSWLLAVASYNCALFGCHKVERNHLFTMINDFPPVYEIVGGSAMEQHKKTMGQSSVTNKRSKRSKSISKGVKMPRASVSQAKHSNRTKQPKEKGFEEKDGKYYDDLCGVCGTKSTDNNKSYTFWILCSVCEKWFHGKCVMITPGMTKHMTQYECPSCSTLSVTGHVQRASESQAKYSNGAEQP